MLGHRRVFVAVCAFVMACGGGSSGVGATDAGAEGGAAGAADGGGRADSGEAGATDPSCGRGNRSAGADRCSSRAPYAYETCNGIGDAVCNVPWDCVTNDLCGPASFLETGGSGSSSGGPAKYTTNGPDTEANARCVIAALRDNTRGRVRFSIAQPQGGFGQTIEILGGEDRRVFGTDSASFDSPTVNHKFASVDLQPASVFATCLATNDVDAYARCLLGALVVCK